MDIGNAPVTNVKKRSYGKITLEQALWYSSNTVFGQVGVQLGSDLLVQMACSFGFNEDIPFDLPLATSLMPDPEEMTTWETAWAACGEPWASTKAPPDPRPPCCRWRWWVPPSPTRAPSCSPTWSTASTTPTASAASRPFP